MLGRTYDRENCSAARALEVVGERWSRLIICNAMFAGSTRFTDFQRKLGIAPNRLGCEDCDGAPGPAQVSTRRGPGAQTA